MIVLAELSLMFAAMIARCAKDIDVLIESLPSEESSTELQVNLTNVYAMLDDVVVVTARIFFPISFSSLVSRDLKRRIMMRR